jgi:hypothetical protein
MSLIKGKRRMRKALFVLFPHASYFFLRIEGVFEERVS